MKQLLIKEFKLTACPLTFIFIAFSAMTMIPGYPILVGTFFICMGIFYTFQFAREYNDVIYTALLPVAKCDIVKARFYFVIIIQMMGFILSTLMTIIRMCFMADNKSYEQNPLMNANLVYLGCLLIILTLFNMIFVTGFFKTAFYFGKPFILFSIAAFIFIGIIETLHHIPGLEMLNTCGWEDIGTQLSVMGIGIITYISGTIYALQKSIRTFDKIDLSF